MPSCRGLNHRTICIQERSLRIGYNDKSSIFKKLLEKIIKSQFIAAFHKFSQAKSTIVYTSFPSIMKLRENSRKTCGKIQYLKEDRFVLKNTALNLLAI